MLDHYLAHLLSSLDFIPWLVYVFVFLAAVIEALPGVGTVFPGHTMIIFSGILVAQAGFSGVLLATLASLGAIIGDGIAYSLGMRYGERFLEHRRPAVRKAMRISHEFFNRHGFWSLILGRFTPITRAFIPAIAGSSRMDPKRFWVANIIGGILWGTTAILLGYGLGKGYAAFHGPIGIYTFFALLGILLFWLFYTYVARQLLKHPHMMRFLAAAAVIALFFLLTDAVGREAETSARIVHEADAAVYSFAASHQAVNLLWVFISSLGSAYVLWPLAIITIVMLRHRRKELMFFSAVTIIGAVLDAIVRAAIGRVRPDPLYAGYSFPSGHALMSTVIYGGLFIILWRRASRRKPADVLGARIAVLLLPLVILLIGASRIALGYHWFTDVIGGFCLGLGILAAVLFFQQFFDEILEKR